MTTPTGNKTDRPLGSADRVKRISKEKAYRDALAVLAEIATNKAEPATVRMQAASIILAHTVPTHAVA